MLRLVWGFDNKTSVESVKLGRALDFKYESESGLKLEIFQPMLDRVKGGQKLYGSSYLSEVSLHTPCTFPSC